MTPADATDSHPDTSRPATARRGRAVLYGLGAGDPDGHVRCTLASHYQLVGGSKDVHAVMRARADELVAEIERQGYRLESLAREDVPSVRRIIDRHMAEST